MASPVIVEVAGVVPLLEPVSNVDDQLIMAPIMQFIYFHKAIRAELERLHCDAMRLEKGSEKEIETLLQRYHFLRTIYEHHSNAEDEVILPALDLRVKNVAHAYCLEHQVESNLFEHLFELLNKVLEAKGNVPKEQLRAVVCCTEALQTTLGQHLSKEEEQVFPLLVEHFSYDEQAALVWQFLCSIPVDLMEKFLPWLASSLSLEDREKMVSCMHKVVPCEELLQQVIFAWMKGTEVMDDDGQRRHIDEVLVDMKSQSALIQTEADDTLHNGPQSSKFPINELLYWHNAIRKELAKLAEEAKMIRSSTTFSTSSLSSFVERLQFLAEVCVFHSAAEDKVLFPAVDQKVKKQVSYAAEHALEGHHFEMVQRLANDMLIVGNLDSGADELYAQAELIMETIQQHFLDEELKVIPLAQKHCSIEEQRVLLYQSLRVMPLKLLERVLPWLVGLLSEEEAKDMLHNMCLAAPVADKHLVALFSGWACKGHPQNIFSSGSYKCIYAEELQECPVKKTVVEESEYQPSFDEGNVVMPGARPKRPRNWDSGGSETPNSCKNAVPKQCCVPGLGMKCTSFGITRVPIRKPLGSPTSSSLGSSLFGWGKRDTISGVGSEPKPIDHIFQFHKAIRKDLEYLDMESASLMQCDESFLRQFSGRFHFLWGLYKAHSNAEDEIVFPALEAKEALHNVSHSYSLDHKQEECLFKEIASLLNELSQLYTREEHCKFEKDSPSVSTEDKRWELAQRLQGMCKSVRCSLDHHVSREELELWPLFDAHFTIEEQDKIVGRIIGTTGAEVLQSMLPWVTSALSEEEQNMMIDSWRQATRNTMFDKWLSAWWSDNSPKAAASPPMEKDPSTPPSGTSESLQLVAEYLAKDTAKEMVLNAAANLGEPHSAESTDPQSEEPRGNSSENCKGCSKKDEEDASNYDCSANCCMGGGDSSEKDKFPQFETDTGKFKPGWQDIFRMNQKELEAAIRKVSSDSSLDPRRKAYLIQNLMTSRWIAAQQHSSRESNSPSEDIPGRSRSYHDNSKGIYGCEHYKRNCKVRAACCGALFTCRFCHDKASDHTMDRHAAEEMMCMQCLEMQPIADSCRTPACGGFKMARYFCSICKFFDNDNRDIYHCPFCNLCRRGKGLGIDYFHCMTCNACMHISLKNHKCREKGLESNCPICHDYLFTSSSPVKALPCNHFMHSDCFQAYTCCHYTCPICSKSLGDMAVYFGMLDALLAAEQLPDEYKGRFQDILCNDCEQKGSAPFHWLYHKCKQCGSYNTRTI